MCCHFRSLLPPFAEALAMSGSSASQPGAAFDFPVRLIGRKQKRAAQDAAIKNKPSKHLGFLDSGLSIHLVSQWAWGQLSAVEVQRLALLAWQDECEALSRCGQSVDHASTSLERLAKLGLSGQYPNNIHRELVGFLGEPGLPPPLKVPIHVIVQKPRLRQPALQMHKLDFMLPHVEFANMYSQQKHVFEQIILGGGEYPLNNPEKFWAGVESNGDPRLTGHPLHQRHNWRSKAIPISVHGDAVPCVGIGRAGTRSLDTYSWQSLFAHGVTLEVKRLMFSVFEHSKAKDHTHGHDTMGEAWEILSWSLWHLWLGTWPTQNWRGELWPSGSADDVLGGSDLAKGFFAVVWLIKGDIEHLANKMNLRHFASNQFCDFCTSDKTAAQPLWPFNFGPDSLWKHQMLDANQWRALNPEAHCIFQKMPFLSQLNVEPDELHVLHLGVSQYIAGSVLWLLTYRLLTGSPVDNINLVWDLVSQFYSNHQTRCQYSQLSLGSFHDPRKVRGEYPRLKGKGAEIKGVIPALRSIWFQFRRDGCPEDQWCQQVLDDLCTVQEILDEDPTSLFLGAGRPAALMSAVDSMFKFYTRLANHADAKGDLLWSMVPKFHWLWHLSRRSQYLHPRRGACLLDEDFVGKLKLITKMCTSSTPLHRVPTAVAEKYRWGMYVLTSSMGL